MKSFLKQHINLSKDENVVFWAAISVFLPYYFSIVAILILCFYILIKTDFRNTVFSHLGSFLIPVFSIYSAIPAIIYKNLLGVVCSVFFLVLMILGYYLRSIMTTELFENTLDLICVTSVFASGIIILEKIIFFKVEWHRCFGDFFNNFYTSLYFHPNYLGSIMAAVILICAYKVVLRGTDKKYYYAIAALSGVTVFLTESMFAWIEVLVGLSILLLIARRHQLLSIMFIVVAFAAALLYTSPETFEKFLPRILQADGTFDNRVMIWDLTIESIKQTPWFGRGFFTYYKISLGNPAAYQTTHAHNIFLESLLSFGIIGSIILVVIIFILFYRVVLCKNLLRKSTITALIFSITAAILIHSIVDMTMLWVQTGLLYCIIMGGIGADEKKINTLFSERFKKN